MRPDGKGTDPGNAQPHPHGQHPHGRAGHRRLRQDDRPDYPLNALRELVLNAITHRDYEHFDAPVRIQWLDDHVEITSPGGPYGVVTKDTLTCATTTGIQRL